MSLFQTPPFDVLADQKEIYPGFGEVLPDSPDRLDRFRKLADNALIRIQEGFVSDSLLLNIQPETLDDLVQQMWAEGWDPESGDVNFFVTDFGLVLTQMLQELVGGQLVFRSENDLNHISLYWPDRSLEVFPFHKSFKCLTVKEGESFRLFVQGVSKLISNK